MVRKAQTKAPLMMEIDRVPFVSLDLDVTVKIFTCLDNPGDIVRAACVSHSWRDFIVSNAICKQLCLIMFPQLSRIAHIVDVGNKIEWREVGCSSSNKLEHAVREHRIYSSLAQNLTSFKAGGCIAAALCASSTDNYPEESIYNTLDARDRIHRRASYWSSSGQKDPSVPERLTYKLISNFCVISEINLQPFQAYFQQNFPIYSAKAVRFHTGHLISPDECGDDVIDPSGKVPADEKFAWTYTSPEFPMTQEGVLQNFKLPQLVLCIGGILQIELLGRVQRQEMDGLFYICMTHVQVLGRSLSPVFGAEVTEPSGSFRLIYNPNAEFSSPDPPEPSDVASLPDVPPEMLQRHVRGWEHILNMLRGNLGMEVYLSDDEHQDSDDEFFDGFAD